MPRHGPQTDKVRVYIKYRDKRKGTVVEKPVDVKPENAWKYSRSPTQEYHPLPKTRVSEKPKAETGGLTTTGKLTPENPEREHTHPTTKGQGSSTHKVGEKHPDDFANSEHRDELLNYHKVLHGEYKPYWPEILHVKHTSKNIKGFDVDVFHHPKVGKAYIINDGVRFKFVVPEKNISRQFPREIDALTTAKNFYQTALQKEFIIKEIDDFVHKHEIFSKIDNLFKAEKPDTQLYSEYQSGDNKASLHSSNGKFSVKVNGSEVVETDNFDDAIKRFYHSVKNIIENEVDDRDQALDLFGETVVYTNRRALEKLSKLGSMAKMLFVKDLGNGKWGICKDD